MHMQTVSRTNPSGKTYTYELLRESYREDGKVKKRTLANITDWPVKVKNAIKNVLSGGGEFDVGNFELGQGKSFGALHVFKLLAHQIGLIDTLGNGKAGKLALLQIIARIVSQRSRLYIAREWVLSRAVSEVLGIDFSFNEDSLYENLDWLAANQEKIEDELFEYRYGRSAGLKSVYLYDVTSSYFEGKQNELANFGYNRDAKKGKKQIVIGLLCDAQGEPVSVEVFEGNTSDTATFSNQLLKLKERFGIERVVMVGDKGMIKSKQIEQVEQLDWHYITSITKAQINTLLKQRVIQMELFEDEPVEVEQDGIRYILRRNPERAKQIGMNRASKLKELEGLLKEKNDYLSNHPRAKVDTAIKHINGFIQKRKLKGIATVAVDKENARKIILWVDEALMQETALLDGCYVIKTDVSKTHGDASTIHDRYKDLAKVESAFRTLKTGLEEIRPIFVRKENRTRGHVFVCMLAYKLIKQLKKKTDGQLDYTLKYIIEALDQIQYVEMNIEGKVVKKSPTRLQPAHQCILDALDIKLPRQWV